MHRVAILAYDKVALFELGCAVELFGLPRPEFENWYECEVVSFSRGPLSSTAGIELNVNVVKDLNNFNLLVIPSWPTDMIVIPERTAKAIRTFYSDNKRIISFCSGAFLLAKLGFLNGKKATTHWRYAQLFKATFPEIEYVDDVLYLYDGRIGCSAGSSAAIDLGLEVIRSDYGFQIANKVARRLVLSAHRKGGQTQFAETPVQEKPNPFVKALDWAMQNLNKPIDICSFAEKANMSRRTFDRKFRANLNLTPKAWLTHQRLNLSKELLENYEYSIEKVAELSGFENATTMRHHFRKELGVSPSFHREQFNPMFNTPAKDGK
ncbi:MAG: helix-turn-helix domain-containing protein [Desulfobacteraceae bacterium]|jgi:AraC family transcriptional activator FtrA